MEYLMAYGWAILIIAVVLGILFQLGVFSSGNFQPHAQAGSCQVSRTAAGVSLEGQCNGLLPEYVANFGSGTSTAAEVEGTSLKGFSTAYPITVTAWVYLQSLNGYSTVEGVFSYGSNCGNTETLDFVSNGGSPPSAVPFIDACGDNYESNLLAPLNTWNFVAYTLNSGGTLTFYLNSQSNTISGAASQVIVPNDFLIGKDQEGGINTLYDNINGYISNVQVYNTTLSSTEVQALYLEGIGGAPIRPQNLAAWWPLNGNLNDYSGNNNNAAPVGNGILYSSSWESGYTPP